MTRVFGLSVVCGQMSAGEYIGDKGYVFAGVFVFTVVRHQLSGFTLLVLGGPRLERTPSAKTQEEIEGILVATTNISVKSLFFIAT